MRTSVPPAGRARSDGGGPADRLRSRVLDVCADELAGARGAALLGFPDHGNVGDSAIWLGQLAVLRELGLGRPRYLCGRRTYDRRTLERRLRPGDAILLSGGGNLGDLWPEEQAFRERVLTDFPDRPVIQLSQSIHFRDADARERARRAFAGHPRFRLLARDRRSLGIARDDLGVEARLCPDMAFGLAPRSVPPAQADASVLWLAREDREARDRSGPPPLQDAGGTAVVRRDWTRDEPDRRIRISRLLRRLLVDHPRSLSWLWRPVARADEAAAEARLARGLRLLSGHRAVVTDRLHGHVLCLLLGRPHVALDNSYGKLSAFHRTWIEGCGWAVRSDGVRDGLETAMRFAEHGTRAEARVPA